MKKELLFALIFTLASLTLLNSCKDDEDPIPVPTEKAFIGSEECASCHGEVYDQFIESGHPYKVMKVTGGVQPDIPFLQPNVPTPEGYSWGDISYTIGGYGWKMRYIDLNGYIITQIAGSQWNPANNTQSVYNSSIPNGTEKYTCGHCHTTGWKSIADGGSAQDGLPGMDGEFFMGGIQCEACHGEGNIHAVTEKAIDIIVDPTGDLCAKCHYRRFASGDLKQQTSGGWEMHRSQHEQLSTNMHSQNGMTCISCHNVHASTRKDDMAAGNGIIKQCAECHTGSEYSANVHMGATCIDCHMPRTVKNAIAFNKWNGDAPNHNFKINISETDLYLTKDGNDVLWANVNRLGTTLDFVCYKCHQDEDGVGGTGSIKTRAELSVKAATFHKSKMLLSSK